MPYLDTKIEKHNDDCSNPVGKRLYIRDYDDNGKQRFVPWGLTCTTCGVVVKEQYQRNLTPKQIEDKEFHEKSKGIFGKDEEWPEYFQRHQKYKINDKLRRLERKKMGPEPITPRESGLRTRIRSLKQFYSSVKYHCVNPDWPDADKKRELIANVWNENLVEQFLNLGPRPTTTELNDLLNPAYFDIPVNSQRWRRYAGFVPDPEKPGWLKRNPEAYTELVLSEAEKRKDMMRQVIRARGLVPVEYSVPPKIRSIILDLATKLEQAGTVRPHKICARLEKDLHDQIEDDKIRSSWISEALPEKYKSKKSRS